MVGSRGLVPLVLSKIKLHINQLVFFVYLDGYRLSTCSVGKIHTLKKLNFCRSKWFFLILKLYLCV